LTSSTMLPLHESLEPSRPPLDAAHRSHLALSCASRKPLHFGYGLCTLRTRPRIWSTQRRPCACRSGRRRHRSQSFGQPSARPARNGPAHADHYRSAAPASRPHRHRCAKASRAAANDSARPYGDRSSSSQVCSGWR
jgi:hypothetical protein